MNEVCWIALPRDASGGDTFSQMNQMKLGSLVHLAAMISAETHCMRQGQSPHPTA
ncbi:hypothetical protein [uncultured Ruegeria sp.]|uniref:hypothetical protein n=1 Tax=uncultured Ruegeria sp. TaxID=259304 RepID=UPI00260DC307|nr:hypothetical protein [uncultured Ruegeria sp.]